MALAPSPDPAYLHAFYHSKMLTPVGWNRLGYRNERVDELLERSQREMDPSARRALVQEAQAAIVADAPHLLLFHPVVVDAARSRLRLPQLPRTPGNRFMYLHRWDVDEPGDRMSVSLRSGASTI
jgi:ABC-type transport system substrate-binding protein